AAKPIEYAQLMRTVRRFVKEWTGSATSGVSISESFSKTGPALPAEAPSANAASAATAIDAPSDKPRGPSPKLVAQFLGGLPQRISGIQAALTSGDMAQLKVLAHQLKGAAGGYG